MAEFESVMEKNLINQLTTGISQWTYRSDLKNDTAIWENIRQKLNQNNKAALQGVEITDAEFEQIKNYLLDQSVTPYKAALWLAGENGEAIIPLTRENAKYGTIHLMAVSSREIAGGRSSYEVINQLVAEKITDDDRTRKFDVTLLINGFPMIHIELKNQAHPFMDAFRQIKKYSIQGKFRGLFGFVQIFVVTNGSNTRYIAADVGERLNETFLTSWVNQNNEPVEDYLSFAKEFLKIPEAHQMVGHYSVLDTERKQLIILRPYQIHAIEAVKEASRNQQSGFIWHTTGSGKTLTSYTVTKNLLQIPSIDKTIFLVDRRDLDQQTTGAFKSYAENDFIDIDNTENTHELLKKLLSADRLAIVTTIQKLQIIIKRYSNEAKKDSPKTKKLRDLHIGFIVDECHRTVTPEVHRAINKFFNYPLWYGFTGTPIFEENKRQRKGDLPRTTFQLFGECLHKYTIKEALKNNAVLGFQIDYMDYAKVEDKKIYKDDNHKLDVIETIVNKSAGKFRLNAPQGNAYEAILTVESIPQAIRYYELIKQFIAEGKVSEAIRERLNDFPKVAITYSVTENEEDSLLTQQAMADALKDYNKMFKTNFSMADLKAYNTNLIDRLARKKGKYKRREEQLDLVIVVDRLLTGFDSPSCAILFIDRPPFKPHHLVQAFSRTNRILDKSKRYGLIVVFQHAEEYKKSVDSALLLYSNGGINEVSAPSFEEIEKLLKQSINELRKIASNPQKVDDLIDIQAKRKFAKTFQKLDRYLGEIQVYQNWADKNIADYGITLDEINSYSGKYQNVLEEIRKNRNPDDDTIPLDVEYELETMRVETIDYRYIVALIQKYIPDEDEEVTQEIKDEKIDRHIENLSKSNPALAEVVGNIWNDIKLCPTNYKGLSASNIINERIKKIIDDKTTQVADEWCLDKNQLLFLLNHSIDNEAININANFDSFKINHDINKLQYRRTIKKVVTDLLNELKNLKID